MPALRDGSTKSLNQPYFVGLLQLGKLVPDVIDIKLLIIWGCHSCGSSSRITVSVGTVSNNDREAKKVLDSVTNRIKYFPDFGQFFL